MVKVNPHALADYGIATGRLPLDGRQAFLVRFAADPVTRTGELLLTPPTRDADRPCPLFAPPRADLAAQAAMGHGTRQRRSYAFTQLATAATRAAVSQAGHDPDDPAVRRAVQAGLRQLAEDEKARRRRQVASRQERERRARIAGRQLPAASTKSPASEAIEARWGTDAEDVQLRREAFDQLAAELAEESP
jgi:hypothetical protein